AQALRSVARPRPLVARPERGDSAHPGQRSGRADHLSAHACRRGHRASARLVGRPATACHYPRRRTGLSADSANLRSPVLRGLAWKGTSQIFLQVSRLAVAVILARMLTPKEYGLAAMALVLASLGIVFSQLAVGGAPGPRE